MLTTAMLCTSAFAYAEKDHTPAALPASADESKPTIYIAGDSTAQTYRNSENYPQMGWGTGVCRLF